MQGVVTRSLQYFKVRKLCARTMSIGENIVAVLDKVKNASISRSRGSEVICPRLVAVSKTKPVSSIVEAYEAGQRVFGENYVNELLQKASDDQLLELCPNIAWHFIGRLQRNKAARLAQLSALSLVETVDSARLADTLHTARQRTGLPPLSVLVQVNTSGELNKGGVEAGEAVGLVQHILDKCPSLTFTGLMTIGEYGRDPGLGPNPDFEALVRSRDTVCQQLGLEEKSVELSMGMSTDFEHAIALGSTNVRVGSQIFGARSYPDKPPPVVDAASPSTDAPS